MYQAFSSGIKDLSSPPQVVISGIKDYIFRLWYWYIEWSYTLILHAYNCNLESNSTCEFNATFSNREHAEVTWGATMGDRDKRCESSSTSVIQARPSESIHTSIRRRGGTSYSTSPKRGAGVRNVLPATDPRGIIGIGRRSPINS
jgi:hypothetical protein